MFGSLSACTLLAASSLVGAFFVSVALFFGQLPTFNLFNGFSWRKFLKQMFSEDYQILEIDDAVIERCRANIA